MQSRSRAWWAPLAQNHMVCVVLLTMLVVPLLAAPASVKSPSVGPMAFEGFAILLLATTILRSRLNGNIASARSFALSGPNLPILAFISLAVLSCAFSRDRAVSVQTALMLASGALLYFAVSRQFRRSEHLGKFADTLILLAIAGAALGCAEYSANPDAQATGLFGDHQLFGSFLMILLPFIAVFAISEKSLNRKLAAQAATVFSLIALMLAQSRSAWIGGGVGLILIGALLAVGAKRESGRGAWRKDILLPALMLVIGVGFFLRLSPVANSIVERAGTLSQAQRQDAIMDRKVTWNGALHMIRERPFTGFGAGLYPYYHYDYAGTGLPIRQLHIRPSLSNQAHNFYLQTAAEMGVPALVALLAILGTFMFSGVRRTRTLSAGLRRDLLIGSLGATAAFAVDAFASPSWEFAQIQMFLWVALGVGVACMTPVVGSNEEFGNVVAPASERWRRRALALGSLGLAALLPTAALATTSILYATADHITITPTTYTTITAGGVAQQYQFQAFIWLTPTENDGPITLDSHTTWTSNGHGTFSAQPGPLPGNTGNAYLDYEAYNSSTLDKNSTVTITATYGNSQNLQATATIQFLR